MMETGHKSLRYKGDQALRSDFIIVGGGISGASAAYFLSQLGSVVLVEQEDHFAAHSSGRSAGQYTVGITSRPMRALAAASRAFLALPPPGFAEVPLITQRGSLTVGRRDQYGVLKRLQEHILQSGGKADRVDRDQALALFPALAPDTFDDGVYEVDAQDIDVDALLQGYLKGARRNGATLLTGARVVAILRRGGRWIIETAGRVTCSAPVLVNAAGGWVDTIAALAGVTPIGIVPYKRTAFTFPLLPGSMGAEWPHVCHADYDWYVKPERGCFIGSPADAIPVAPGDVYPDDVDVAQGIHNIEQGTTLRVHRPLNAWAGLRSYVRDRNPVCGALPDSPGFIWLAGQGGCGVLASPAIGQAVAGIVQNKPLPEPLAALGLTAEELSPARLTLRAA
jgi:D-arginine dehydrogenase